MAHVRRPYHVLKAQPKMELRFIELNSDETTPIHEIIKL